MSSVPLDDAAAVEPVEGVPVPELEFEELHPAVTATPSASSAIAESPRLLVCISILLRTVVPLMNGCSAELGDG
jgi:hypothetical protein